MNTLLEYLNDGYAKAGTWQALAYKLDVNLRTVTHWKQGRGYPNQKTMCRIARYVSQPETVALVQLQIWTTKGKVRKVWMDVPVHQI